MNTITLAVSRLRKEQGVTQKELAEHLGVSCQSVSKWENGITLPDIQLLPEIAAFFKVSVDQLLGLKKLYNNAYTSRKSNTPSYWKEKHDYLESTRKKFWNQDYFDFLVKQVWNLNKPINIIDFGCGYGFLGAKLWSSELDNEKRDFACGLRLPIIMTQLGLKDVDVRMNDKVTYISGQGENDLEQVNQVCIDKGWKKLSEKERSEVVGLLENRGYLPEEVRLFIESNDSVFNFIENRKSLPKMVSVTGTLISYGYKH